jgi:anti-sigma B factor antagonist
MANLKLDSKRIGEVVVLYPRGYIDAHTVKDFENSLQELLEGGGCRIVISGKDLTYIASAGLGALMGVIEEVRSREGDIRLTELTESVFNVFDILGFTHLFQIYGSEEEALRSFQA